jgi:putative ABC transport system permease protein
LFILIIVSGPAISMATILAYKAGLSWQIFVLTGFIALGIAVLTVSLKSWLAARRNPAEVIREE